MSKETLATPLPPIDARTEAVAERLFGLKWALRKDSTEIIHEEWRTASEWIRDGYLRQAIEVLAAADQAEPASAKVSGYKDRMRVEYRELTARAGRLRDMLQRYADGTLDFEPTCPISLLSRQLDVMDEYSLILRRRANIEHIGLGGHRRGHGHQGRPMSDTADRIRAAVQGVTGLPDALAQPMRQLGHALAQIGSLPADPTNEPTKENKQ